MNRQFSGEVRSVTIDRPGTNVQIRSDFPGGFALGRKLQYLALARGQLCSAPGFLWIGQRPYYSRFTGRRVLAGVLLGKLSRIALRHSVFALIIGVRSAY